MLLSVSSYVYISDLATKSGIFCTVTKEDFDSFLENTIPVSGWLMTKSV